MSIIIFVGCSVFIKMIIHYEISDDSDDNKIHRKRDTDNNAITRNHAILHAAKPRKIHWGKRSSDSVIYFRPGDLIGDEGKRSPCLRAGALTRTHTHTRQRRHPETHGQGFVLPWQYPPLAILLPWLRPTTEGHPRFVAGRAATGAMLAPSGAPH